MPTSLNTPVNLPPFPWQRAFTITAWGLLATTILTFISRAKTLIAISEIVDTAFMVGLVVIGAALLIRKGLAPAATTLAATAATPAATTAPATPPADTSSSL